MMDSRVPRLSIGMAVYNGADLIAQALQCLLAQTFADFELIISDNGSTDGTEAICRQHASRDARVRYVRQPENRGPAFNFAYVLDAARAPYFMFAAHDDRWEPEFAARLIAALDAEPDAVLAFSRWDAINQNGEHILSFDTDWSRILSGSLFSRFWSFVTLDESRSLKALFYYGVMRRDAWRDAFHWGNRYHAYAGSDVLMLLRMLDLGRFAFVDEVLFHNRIRPLQKRGDEPLASYVRRRAHGRSSGHRGSALAFIGRAHEYACGMRAAIRSAHGLTAAERAALVAATVVREAQSHFISFPLAILRELGLIRPPVVARVAEV
jgi:glycosyltransferase involved in cell wall biosynthesis